MAKNIVMCFDGTWNRPAEFERDPSAACDTNVRRFYMSIEPFAADGRDQVAVYDDGVGTEPFNRLRGAALGRKLDEHILDGYEYLCRNYEESDKVYIIGFSRGAYSARSLIGLTRKCGVLRSYDQRLAAEAYELYRRRDADADSPDAVAFRDRHSRMIEIEFLGVWDTVGALGIPLSVFDDFNEARHGFHDTTLSSIVKNAFHALALDEHREPYKPTFLIPSDTPGQRVEQVWFAGAHSDVGGGYLNQPLSNPPLRWMQQRAIECGLSVRVLPEAAEEEAARAESLAPGRDSYSEFMGGLYAHRRDRYYRAVGRPEDGPQKLHWTVKQRLDEVANYAPSNEGFVALVDRGGIAMA